VRRRVGWPDVGHGRTGAHKTAQHYAIAQAVEDPPSAWTADAYSLDFNGSDEYARGTITGGSPLQTFTTDATLMVWHKTPALGANDGLFCIHKGTSRRFQIHIDGNGTLRANCKTDSATITTNGSSGGYDDDDWHAFTLAFTGGNVERYIDGVHDINTALAGQFNDSGNEMTTVTLAAAANLGSKYTGGIATAAAWKTALTTADTLAIAARPTVDLLDDASYDSANMAQHLIYWCRCGDGTEAASGTTYYDMSGVATVTDLTGTNLDDTNYQLEAPA
tara:strand:+ start:1237 stop:2067 length:831 start_codon:yes stop_codon:yes gene_type:complete